MPNDWCDPASWFYDSGNLKPANSIPQNTNDIYVDNNLSLDLATINCIDKISYLKCENLSLSTSSGTGNFIVGFLNAKNVSLNKCNIINYTDEKNPFSLYTIDSLSLTDSKAQSIAFDIAEKISGVSSLVKDCLFLSDGLNLYFKDSILEGLPSLDFPYSDDLRSKLKLSAGTLIKSYIENFIIENNSELYVQNNSSIKKCQIKSDVTFTNHSDHLNPSIINGNCEFWDMCKNYGTINGNVIFHGGGAINYGTVNKKAIFDNGGDNYGTIEEAEFYGNGTNYGNVGKATFYNDSINLGNVGYAIFKGSGCYNEGKVYEQAIFFTSGSYNNGVAYNAIFNSGTFNHKGGIVLGSSCSLDGAENKGTINVDNTITLNNSYSNSSSIISNSGNVVLISSSGNSHIYGYSSILLDKSYIKGELSSPGLVTVKNNSNIAAVVWDVVFYDSSFADGSTIINIGNFYNDSYLISSSCRSGIFNDNSANYSTVIHGVFNNNSKNSGVGMVFDALFYNNSNNQASCNTGLFYNNSTNGPSGNGDYLRFYDTSVNAGSSYNFIVFSGNSLNVAQIKNAAFFENSSNSGNINLAFLYNNTKNNGYISSGYLFDNSINNGGMFSGLLRHKSVNDKGYMLNGFFDDSSKNNGSVGTGHFYKSSSNDTKGSVNNGFFYDESINKGKINNGNFYNLSTNNSIFDSRTIFFYDHSSNIGNININNNLKFDDKTFTVAVYSGQYPVFVGSNEQFLSDFFCDTDNFSPHCIFGSRIEFKDYSTNKGNLKGYRDYIFHDNSKNFGQLSSYHIVPNHATIAYFSENSINCANIPKGKIIFSNGAINSGNISFGEFLNHSINYGNINSYSLPDTNISSNFTPCYTIPNTDTLYFYNASINYGQILLSNGMTLNGEDHKIKAVFDYAINVGNIAGSAIFNHCINSGFVMKNSQFNDSINYGTIGGNGYFVSGINYGTIKGSGSFLSNSINYGKVINNSYLYNSKNISGIINGITYLYDNSINSGNLTNSGLFYNNSLNFGDIKGGAMFSDGSKNLAGVVGKQAIFKSQSYNYGLVIGSGYFNNSYNQGYIQGDATFTNASSNGMDDISLSNYLNTNNQAIIDSIMSNDNLRNVGNGYVSKNVILESGTHNYGLIGGNVYNNMGYNCGYVLGTGSLVGIDYSTECTLNEREWEETYYPTRPVTVSRYFNINNDYYFFDDGYWRWVSPNKFEADRRASVDISYFNSKLENFKSGIPITQ
jgi:hypothetical protein